jgi:hypothetical protein
MANPTYGGVAIFGKAVSITMAPNPNEVQRATFFGETGVYSALGGGRGKTFQIQGVFYGSSLANCIAMRTTFLSYSDNVARVLVDTAGVSWAYVVFNGVYQQADKFGYNGSTVYLPYTAVFEGLV